MSGGTTRRHDGDADPTPVPLRIAHTFRVLETLNSVDFLQKIGHRPAVERHLGQGALILLILLEAPTLEHALGRIVGQHAIEVEGNAQIRLPIVCRGAPHDVARRETQANRLAHVGLVRGEEEGHAQRLHEAIRGAALHEDRARDVQTVTLNRTHHPHPGLRVVARKNHNLHEPLPIRQVVQVEQATNEGKRDARFEHVIEMFALILPIPFLPLLAEYRVRLFQVEQGTRGDPNDEGALQIELGNHGRSFHSCRAPRPTLPDYGHACSSASSPPQDDRRGRGRLSRTDSTREKPRKKHRVIMPHSPL